VRLRASAFESLKIVKVLLASSLCLVGGAETFMLALASALRAADHRCELFFFRHGPFEQYIPRGYITHFGDLADCMRLVDDGQFDVVHARTSDWPTGISAVRRLGAKLVVTSHGHIQQAWNSANCDALVGCSQWLAEKQQALTDIPVHAVLNGIDLSKFADVDHAAVTSPPIVAWVGRGVDPRKHLEKFAAIAPSLRRRGLRLWVIDPYGPDSVGKVNAVAAEALAASAEFWGAVPVERMPATYRAIAASGGCVLSTAAWEGLPLALLEAQASACPVIAPDVRGINECVDPANGGVLYPFAMPPQALARVVVDTVSDGSAMAWRRTACAAYMHEQFASTRMAHDYLAIYQGAPDLRHRRYGARLRISRQLWSLRNWNDYVARRWTVGHQQFSVSQQFARRGEWRLAKAAAQDSFFTSPTLYVRPKRLMHLITAHRRARTQVAVRSEPLTLG